MISRVSNWFRSLFPLQWGGSVGQDREAAMLTPEIQQQLRESFILAAPHAEKLAESFYNRLFALAPEVRQLFRGDMKLQGQKLIEMLAWIVAHAGETDALRAALAEAGRRHASYGVNPDHFAPVGSALIHCLHATLGDQLTPEAEEAWIEAYAVFAREMEEAGAQAA